MTRGDAVYKTEVRPEDGPSEMKHLRLSSVERQRKYGQNVEFDPILAVSFA